MTPEEIAQHTYRMFEPLMKRLLLRDPYVQFSIQMMGIERNTLRMALCVHPHGCDGFVPLGPEPTERQLDELFKFYPPAPRTPAVQRPTQLVRPTPETPVAPVPALVCIECGGDLPRNMTGEICPTCFMRLTERRRSVGD